jgi:hypothetical protein
MMTRRASKTSTFGGKLATDGKVNMDIEEKMSCPADLSEWVNANPKAMWFVYDINLMPEQITNRGEVCALRGFKYGWEARGLKEAAEHRMYWTALLVGLGSFVLGFATCAIILYWL